MPDPKPRLIPYSSLYLGLSVVLYGVMFPLLLRLAVAPLAGLPRVLFGVLAALCGRISDQEVRRHPRR